MAAPFIETTVPVIHSPVPQRTQGQDDFNANADAFLESLSAIPSAVNEVSGQMNAQAVYLDALKDTVAQHKAMVAADKASVATDKAAVAADKVTVAMDKATVAADKATVSTDKAAVAADKATVAMDKATVAANKLQVNQMFEAAGAVRFYNTYAEALADLAVVSNLSVVEIFADETKGGARCRYRKESGALVFKMYLNAQYESLKGLVGNVPFFDGVTAEVSSFYSGYAASTAGACGGGKFVWVASAAKSLHDGALYISPTVPWDGTDAGVAAWQNKTGETSPSGTGCWRRVRSQGEFNAAWWGTIGNNASVNNQPMFQKCFDRANAIGGKRKIIIPNQGVLYVQGITNYYGNEIIEGEAGATIKQNSSFVNPIFLRSGNTGPSWVDYVIFRNLTLIGYWETIQDGYVVANGLLTGTYIRTLRI